MQPSRPDSHAAISVIEDLDPEVGGGRDGGVRLDLLLGIPLILAVVLFAGWQWWRQDYMSGQYRAGQEAAGKNDLIAAMHYYAEASGYSNADALLQSTREQLAERDRLYKSAVDFAEQQQWLPALRDVRALAKIQPGYKDIAALEDMAIANVYTDALSATVILRENANPPGLYYRGTSGWVWLEGSDAKSDLFGINSEGYILYEVRNPKYMPSQLPPAPTSGYNSYPERLIVAAHNVDGRLQYAPMSLNPRKYAPTVIGKNGFWALNYDSSLLDGTSDQGRYVHTVVDRPLHESSMAYQSFSDTKAAYVSLRATEDIATGSTIVDVNPDDNHYLVAEWTGANGPGPAPDTVVNLYLRAAGETLNKQVYSYTGGSIQSAILSPDNRYAAVTAYQEIVEGDTRSYKITASLIDLESGREPKVLNELVGDQDIFRYSRKRLTAMFVHSGGFEGKVVLAEYTPQHTNIRLIDPDKAAAGDPGYILKQLELLGDIDGQWRIREQNDTGIAVTTETYTNQGSAPEKGNYTLHAVVLPVDGPLETYRIRSESTHEISVMRASGSYIRWSDSDYADPEANPMALLTRSIYNVDSLNDQDNRPDQRVRFSADASIIGKGSQAVGSINPGNDLMVYIVDGELHAHTYDGDVDIVLESGVTAYFEKHLYDASWLR